MKFFIPYLLLLVSACTHHSAESWQVNTDGSIAYERSSLTSSADMNASFEGNHIKEIEQSPSENHKVLAEWTESIGQYILAYKIWSQYQKTDRAKSEDSVERERIKQSNKTARSAEKEATERIIFSEQLNQTETLNQTEILNHTENATQ